MPNQPTPLDDEIQALYQGPLAEFTATRQELAKRLRGDGDPRHEEVRTLRKPPVSAWAVNRLFASEADAMAGLGDAGEQARATQQQTGKGKDLAALRELVATIRSETERLTDRGVEILTEAERAPGEAIVERLRTNLQALALDPAAEAVAERRWLDQDLDPPGFELLAALTVATSEPRPKRPQAPARHAAAKAPQREDKSATVHRLDEGRKAAAEREERKARERRERIERAEAELARTEAEAAAEREAADRAEGEAKRVEAEAAEAERLAEAARSKARTATQTLREARTRAAGAETVLARAREALERARRS